MRVTGDKAERVRIDLIDVDREIFVDEAGQRASRSRQVLKVVGLVAVISVAAVAWWPRSQPAEWKVFHPAVVPAAGLTERLVFDNPPGELLGTDLAPPAVDVKPELGYVFGAPGGTYLTRRWASFRSHADRSATTTTSTIASPPLVAGVTADVRRVRVRHFVDWGPVDGRTWSVTTNRFSDDEAIDFANHVAIIDDKPALANRYDLGDMEPVGSIAAFDCVSVLTSLFRGDRVLGPVMPTIVSWGSPAAETSLGSIAAPADALPLVEFVLGEGRTATVHGQPAVIIASNEFGPVVAWLEDGRLIVIRSAASDAELLALAETVRPATDDEWTQIEQSDIRVDDGVRFELRDSVRLFGTVDLETRNTIALSVQVVGDQLMVCVERIGMLVDLPTGSDGVISTRTTTSDPVSATCQAQSLKLPLLMTMGGSNHLFVLAIVDPNTAVDPELRIAIAGGTWTIPLQSFRGKVPGLVAAAELPDGYGHIELVNSGGVVATHD